MYKVLVVDDEPRVRRGLRNLIPQLDAEWTVTGEAKNGLEALEMVRKEMPDLVITDIRMPSMNGLDLLNALKEYPVHVVILSGYGYFEYAKAAIRFGAFDFLLKPLKPEEVQDLLARLKRQLQTNKPQPAGAAPNHPYSKLWKDWLMGVEETDDYPSRLREQMPAASSRYQIIAVEIDHFDELVTEDQWGDRQLVSFTVRNIVHEIFAREEKLSCRFLFAGGAQLYFLLVDEDCPLQLLELMIFEVKRWVKISISVGISDETDRFEKLPDLFGHAKEALLNKWIYGNGSVHAYSQLFLNDDLQAGYPNDLDAGLVVAIREGRKDKAEERLQQFAVHLLAQNAAYHVFRRYCLQLMSSVVRIVYEQKITSIVFQDEVKPYDLFGMQFTPDEFLGFMKRLIASCIASMDLRKQMKHNRTLEHAVSYIHQHYAKDLSLDEVAGHAQMSSSYFSSFFKQEMGASFVEYLTGLRMEKAKGLMMDPDLKLYEIAQMVGYQDVKYFSRLFKKTEGVAPVEYRQFFYRKDEDDAR